LKVTKREYTFFTIEHPHTVCNTSLNAWNSRRGIATD